MGEAGVVCASAWVLLLRDSIRHNLFLPAKVLLLLLSTFLLWLQSGLVRISLEKALSEMADFHFKDCNTRAWNVNPMLQMQPLVRLFIWDGPCWWMGRGLEGGVTVIDERAASLTAGQGHSDSQCSKHTSG